MAVYSVSQVTSYLRALLERDAVARDLWVGGEVASLSRSATGHSYFSLRETDSTLRCVMFRNSLGAERLAGGAAVSVLARHVGAEVCVVDIGVDDALEGASGCFEASADSTRFITEL